MWTQLTISRIRIYCVTWQGQKILFSPKYWDQLWGPPSPLINGHQQLFRWRCSNSGSKTNLHSPTCLYVMQWQSYLYRTYTVTKMMRSLLSVQTVPIIVSPSMAASAHTKLASVGTSRVSCRAQRRHIGRTCILRQKKCNERKICFIFL